MRLLKILAISLVTYVAIGLIIKSLIGYFQPPIEAAAPQNNVDDVCGDQTRAPKSCPPIDPAAK